ncbi:amidohydrolase family protein [Fusobacterium simiae]|uniref:amidohydrolase family protein n=1 Tax=Fusobacterium simiae TaxID=855 RepID=UPI0020C4C3D8|nr:amidohydrolase family protein [Fusobacterium simiae]MDC7956346.1 amidohydrolase family protein [Fusobacterium simiae]
MIIDSHEHLILPTESQIKKLEDAGVDKAILFTITPHPEKANTIQEFKNEMSILFKVLSGEKNHKNDMERMRNNINDLMEVLNKYPNKFYGFGPVPLGLSLDETISWIEKYIISNNLKGVGEFTPGNDEQVKQLEIIFQALENYSYLPIWVHTFYPVTLNGINILINLTKKYPKVPVIFGHMGGYHWINVIDFVKKTPNAYLDLSASFSTLVVKMAIAEVPNKCLYSSDAPYGEPLLNKQMIEYLCYDEKIKNDILGNNILKLLNLNS